MQLLYGILGFAATLCVALIVYAFCSGRWRIATKLIGICAAGLGCMAASGGCSSDLHRASLAAGSIAASVTTASQVNHTNTFEDADEKKAVADLIIQVAVANNNFIGVVRSAEADGGKVPTAAVVGAFKNLVTQVDQLNNLGVLRLKSPQAQEAFQTVIVSIRTELAVIQGLAGGTSTAQARTMSPGGVATAGIALSVTEIEELIGLAIAAGSQLVPKLLALRGESDGEILTQAETDDQAAIDLAKQDGGEAPAGESPGEGDAAAEGEEDKEKAQASATT